MSLHLLLSALAIFVNIVNENYSKKKFRKLNLFFSTIYNGSYTHNIWYESYYKLVQYSSHPCSRTRELKPTTFFAFFSKCDECHLLLSARVRQLLFAIRERNKYDSVFLRALDELSDNVDFSWVKSCVAMGTGHGLHEIGYSLRGGFCPICRHSLPLSKITSQ